jgi:hypothetical protein
MQFSINIFLHMSEARGCPLIAPEKQLGALQEWSRRMMFSLNLTQKILCIHFFGSHIKWGSAKVSKVES